MKRHYNDPKFPGSFSGQERFYKALKQVDPTVTRKSVKKELQSIDSYTLYKPKRRQPLYRRVLTHGINYLYQCDLVDVSSFKNENDGYNFIITIIDTFSKKAWAFKLKQKSAKSIVEVMKPFFEAGNVCKKIQFDQGSEFYNKLFLDLLKKHKIDHYSVYSDVKAQIVERFNRTLKTRMMRYFNASGSHRWIDVLQDLIDGYNNTKHRSIGFATNEVNRSNEAIVRKKLFPKIVKQKKYKKSFFKIGDTVRITRKKGIFEKGYDLTWSWEVFTVSRIVPSYPKQYEISDFTGEPLKGSFYKNELQLVDKSDNIWPIEKIIRSRKKRGQTEYLVKFQGYPDSANSWVPHSDLFNV